MSRSDDATRLEKHADHLVARILGGDSEIRLLAIELGDLWRASGYRSGRLSLWHAVGQAVALVEAGEDGAYDDADEASLDDAIRREAELYREFAAVEIPDDLVHVALCNRCGHLDRPVVERSDRVFRPPPPSVSCASCGARDLTGTHDFAGRRALLLHLKRDSGEGFSGA